MRFWAWLAEEVKLRSKVGHCGSRHVHGVCHWIRNGGPFLEDLPSDLRNVVHLTSLKCTHGDDLCAYLLLLLIYVVLLLLLQKVCVRLHLGTVLKLHMEATTAGIANYNTPIFIDQLQKSKWLFFAVSQLFRPEHMQKCWCPAAHGHFGTVSIVSCGSTSRFVEDRYNSIVGD